jgi:TolA-binding protein
MPLKYIYYAGLLLSINFVFGQDKADTHYQLLDDAYKNISVTDSVDFIISEIESYALLYPNSKQEDELLFRLGKLYERENQHARQLTTLVKLILLHGESPIVTRSLQIMDSLIVFDPGLDLKEDEEEAIRQLGNHPSQKNYRMAYLGYLSFLQSIHLSTIEAITLQEIEHYKNLFLKDAKDMDAVLFWQAQIYKRNQKYDAAILTFSKVCSLYSQSPFVPEAMLELARLSASYKKNKGKARDYLIELINQFPASKLTGDAQFELAQLYEKVYKDRKEAFTNYNLQVNAFPKNKHHFTALLRMAAISEQDSNYNEAIIANMRIVEDEGDPASVNAALKNIIRLSLEKTYDFRLAAKTMALLAHQFPENTDAPKYLYRAGKLYIEELKDFKNASEAFDLLIKNYPQSVYIKKIKSLLNQADKK